MRSPLKYEKYVKFIDFLRNCDSWFCDGTFRVVPDLFTQLYTIHAEKDGVIFPCIYALLPNKTEATYDRLFMKLLEIEPSLNPLRIMVDFEKAAINALEENFISVITGCFFHHSQNIFRHVQEQGLADDIKRITISLLVLRCLPVWLLFQR